MSLLGKSQETSLASTAYDGTSSQASVSSGDIESDPRLPPRTAEADVETPLYAKQTLYSSASAVKERGSAALTDADTSLIPQTAKSEGRYPYLDLTRVACVWFVACDHGNPEWGVWNVMFGQNWVLQYLFLVSGVSFGMSSRPLWGYVQRLGSYFCIGVLCNWSAWAIKGLDWRNSSFNVVFQFWFVFGLMGYCCLLMPLKPILERLRSQALQRRVLSRHVQDGARASHPSTERTVKETLHAIMMEGGKWLTLFLFGPLAISMVFSVALHPLIDLGAPYMTGATLDLGGGAVYWGMPQSDTESRVFLTNVCHYTQLTLGSMLIVVLYPMMFEDHSKIGWLVLLNTYAHRCIFYRAKDERPFHAFDLMVTGMICYYLGLHGRRKVGGYMKRYWIVFMFLATIIWPTGQHGRFEEDPPHQLEARVRYNVIEAGFVVLWLVAGDRLADVKIFSSDRMEFLNTWALVLFLVHQAVHIVVPKPFNWIVLIFLAPVCWWVHKMRATSNAS